MVLEEKTEELLETIWIGTKEQARNGVPREEISTNASEALNKLVTAIFWNTGVRLVCEGSTVINHLKRLEEQGIEILACTTCLEYFDLVDKLKVGKPTTMVKSIQSMLNLDMVCL